MSQPEGSLRKRLVNTIVNDFARNVELERRIEFSTDLATELGMRRRRRASGAPLNLRSAQLQEAMLRFADLPAADLESADLSGAALQHACFNNANLGASNLSGARLDHANLSVANLKQARLCGASLHLANLEAADLEGADLTRADLLHTRLKEANLRGANLSSARLDHADFAGADLRGANLSGASLHHAKNLTRAQLKVTRKSRSTILPPHLQGSTSRSATRKKAGALPTTASAQNARGPGLSRLAFSRQPAWVGLGVIATLTVVGVAWQQITGAIRYAQPEVKLRPAGKLATLSASRARNVRDWPLETSQVFAELPETELRESPLQTSYRLLKDTTPLAVAGVQNGAIQVLPDLSLISPAEDTLHSVTTIRKVPMREIAKLPIDPNEGRKAGNQPIDTSVAGQVTVTASYYGKELAGRRTASGEKFNPSGMTAAHRTLPFGTRVRVTHPRNGRSVTVRINDRGPFIKGRSIDLSAGAAAAIGMGGTGRVHLKVLR
jgi:uncharacterized protein YjbI with pentapeptide repeats